MSLRLLLLSDDFVQYIDGELGSKKPPRFVPYFTRALILFSIVKNVHK